MGQWMAGFCRTMRDENCIQNKGAMLDYLISLLDDSNDFSWSSTKACYAVFLCRMDQGEIKDYTQTNLIDQVRRAHAQKHAPPSQNAVKNPTKNFPGRDKNARSMICQFFNQGTCFHQATHEIKGITYKHVCNYCFTKHGKAFPHSEIDCKTKLKNSNSKKRINLGVRHVSSPYWRDRIFWNSKNVHSKDIVAFNAHTQTAFEWFRVSKCFNNIRDHRTYVQVTRNSLPKQENDQGIHSCYLRSRIVTLRSNQKSLPLPR